MEEHDQLQGFEQSIMPHLDAAYNLARWLTGADHDAQDVVQEAYARAFKFFAGFRGGNSRSWLLRIVRNVFYDWLKENRRGEVALFDEALHDRADPAAGPDALLLAKADHELVRQALAQLPAEFREVLVLREMEDLSYKEIAEVMELPLGTVMSRLARGRDHLRALVLARANVK